MLNEEPNLYASCQTGGNEAQCAPDAPYQNNPGLSKYLLADHAQAL